MPHDVCHWRYAYLFDNPLRRLFHNPATMLQAHVKRGMTVLDVGCGMGFFSIGMARLVGPEGQVHSVDLQQEMLDVLEKRAARRGVADNILTHRCTADSIAVKAKVDFILAFWMVHEVPNQLALFTQLRSVANSDCKLLIAEPKIHVTANDLAKTIRIAEDVGWKQAGESQVRLSISALFCTGEPAAD